MLVARPTIGPLPASHTRAAWVGQVATIRTGHRMKAHQAARNALSVVVGTAFVACASIPGYPDDADIALIRLVPDPSRVSLTSRMDGALAVQNGCVYIISTRADAASLALWPPNYRLWRSRGRINGVINTATGQTLAFGVEAMFDGGESKHVSTSELEAPIPPACDGPAVYAEFSSS